MTSTATPRIVRSTCCDQTVSRPTHESEWSCDNCYSVVQVSATSANHVQLSDEKREARDDARDHMRQLIASWATVDLRFDLPKYVALRNDLSRDSSMWWATHGIVMAIRHELRARSQQLLDDVAESEVTDPDVAGS